MSKHHAAEEWMSLDQIRSEYASNEYSAELLLMHLLHWTEEAGPNGWKLVPIVATEEMILEGSAKRRNGAGNGEVYAAMVAAAPQPMKEDK